MHIIVNLVGDPRFNRYMLSRITDGVKEYWTGKAWHPEIRMGILYLQPQDMANEYERLELEQVSHLPERVFEARIVIRVRAGEDFTVQQLRDYLHAAVLLHVDHDKGKGPTPDSMAFLKIEWASTKEISEGESTNPQV